MLECVEIELVEPVKDEIWVYDHWHRVEFESLHLIGADCGCYGHVARNCAQNVRIFWVLGSID